MTFFVIIGIFIFVSVLTLFNSEKNEILDRDKSVASFDTKKPDIRAYTVANSVDVVNVVHTSAEGKYSKTLYDFNNSESIEEKFN